MCQGADHSWSAPCCYLCSTDFNALWCAESCKLSLSLHELSLSSYVFSLSLYKLSLSLKFWAELFVTACFVKKS
jgi:hypothetical protein